MFSIYIRPCFVLLLFRVKYTNTLLCLYSLKGITCFAIVYMSYTCCARQFARAIMNERIRQRTYLHSTDMRYQPSYSVYRSEPVRAFGSRRYNSNVRLSVKLETRQPRYNRTQKKVRFDDSCYECEIRYPTQSPSRGYEPEFRYLQYSSRCPGPRSQNTWDSNPADIRYETREPKVIHHGLHEMSGSGRRLLRQRGRGPSLWF